MLTFGPKSDISIRVKFLNEWMGNKPGVERDMWEHVADKLLQRGIVEFVDRSKELEESSKEVKAKGFRRPVKDKMIKESPSDK